jgi:signal transduction histidine kinase
MLRPSVLDDLGLEPALVALTQDFERRTGIQVDGVFELTGVSVTEQVQVAVYRVVQEALTNVARHSGAKRALVRVTRGPEGVEIVVEDNGKGAVASPTPHMGLLGMRERVTELGGRFRVVTRPQEGFRIEATLPREVKG